MATDEKNTEKFNWVSEEGLEIKGKPDYEEISLTRDGVRVTKRGERPH